LEGVNISMLISRRWIKIVPGIAQKVSLLRTNYFPVVVQSFPVPRNEIPCFCTGSGGRSTASGDVCGRPAPWRRPVDAAPVASAALVKIVGESHILCYVCSLRAAHGLGAAHGRASMSNFLVGRIGA